MKACGFLNIRKEAGMTSHDVVGRIRRLYGLKRVGHTGTLDPMASGVLPAALGSATRFIEYLEPDLKTYRAVIRFGKEYDTQDVWGTVIREAPEETCLRITEDSLRRAMAASAGVIRQVPPMYSAVKVNGRRLYEYAREGAAVARKARTVWIPEIRMEKADLGPGSALEAVFTMVCSRGTYVRTVCEKIGRRLGTAAAMAGLVRTGCGAFLIEHAHTLGELEQMTEQERLRCLIPPERVLGKLGAVRMKRREAVDFVNGKGVPEEKVRFTRNPSPDERPEELPLPEIFFTTYVVCTAEDGRFVGTAQRGEGQLRPAKVLAEAADALRRGPDGSRGEDARW